MKLLLYCILLFLPFCLYSQQNFFYSENGLKNSFQIKKDAILIKTTQEITSKQLLSNGVIKDVYAENKDWI